MPNPYAAQLRDALEGYRVGPIVIQLSPIRDAAAELDALEEIHDAAYAVWMAFLAGTAQELQWTLQNLSAAMYERHAPDEEGLPK